MLSSDDQRSTPDVSLIYAQTGLDQRVVELLPTGTSGGTVMLLFAVSFDEHLF